MVTRGSASTLRFIGLLLALPGAVAAQFAERVRWPLVDVVVRGDTNGAFELLAAPNLGTKQGLEPHRTLDRFRPLAFEVLQWAALMKRAVDSLDKLRDPPPFATIAPRLNRPGDSASFYLGLSGKRRPRFRFVVDNAPHRPAWQVEASAAEIHALLRAMVHVAERTLHLDRAAARAVPAGEAPCPVSRDEGPDAPDAEPPRLLYSDLALPRLTLRREGRVWLEFTVDSTGRVDQSSACILLTDDEVLSERLLKALPSLMFRPARAHDVPVPAVVFQEFRFVYQR